MDNTREKLIELLEFAMDYSYVMRELKKTTTDANENPFIAMADFLIANGVTVQKWIPVTERLPEEDGYYLVYCGEYDGICVIYYENLVTKGKWMCKWKEVTHWMPLPEPPRGE